MEVEVEEGEGATAALPRPASDFDDVDVDLGIVTAAPRASTERCISVFLRGRISCREIF